CCTRPKNGHRSRSSPYGYQEVVDEYGVAPSSFLSLLLRREKTGRIEKRKKDRPVRRFMRIHWNHSPSWIRSFFMISPFSLERALGTSAHRGRLEKETPLPVF